jgi:plasmid stabilization system protein ParE
MGKRVIWKTKPKLQVRAIEAYLRAEFGGKAVDNFLDKMYAKLEQVSNYPEIGRPTRFKTIRRIKAGKFNHLYYRIHGSKIFILFVWDGRQDPGKNPYR